MWYEGEIILNCQAAAIQLDPLDEQHRLRDDCKLACLHLKVSQSGMKGFDKAVK